MTEPRTSQSNPGIAPMLAPAGETAASGCPAGNACTANCDCKTEACDCKTEACDCKRENGQPSVAGVPGSTSQWLVEHYEAVYRYAYRLTGNATAAEDVAQEVFVRALKSSHQLREPQAVKGWLLVITRNEFSRWCRKFGALPPLSGAECCSDASTGGELDRAEWVQKSLLELPLEFRLVVTMFYFERLSYIEIAEALEIPLGTVMSRLNRARKQLKEALNALSEPN